MLILADLWLLGRMSVMEQSALYLSVKYQDGKVSELAFENFTDSESGKNLSLAAAWKKEENREATSKLTKRKQQLTCYFVKGQPEAVFGRTLLSGRYFLNQEKAVCLLDRFSAWRMFGTEYAVGNELQINDQTYRVAGILSGENPICILPAAKGSTFDGVTIRRKNNAQSVQTIVSNLDVYAGGKAEQVTDGQLYAALPRILFGLNLASACFLLCMVAKRKNAGKAKNAGEQKKTGRKILPALFVSMIVFVISVRFSGLGRDYLPTYWSDFDFFVSLWKEKAEAVLQFSAHQEFWQEQLLWTRCVQTAAGSILLIAIQLMYVFFNRIHAASPEPEQHLQSVSSSDIPGLPGR